MSAESKTNENPKSSGRRARRQAETRKRLLTAARQVFADTGVANATIAQIAKTADLGFGTFYLHFQTKEEAYLAVINEGFAELDEQLDEILEVAQKQQIYWSEVINLQIRQYFEFARDNYDLFLVGFAGLDIGMRSGVELRRHYADKFNQMLAQEINRNQVDKISDKQLELICTGIVAMLSRTAIWWMQQDESDIQDSELSIEAVSELVSQFAIGGITNAFPFLKK
ncbi:MAG: TetR/AcrR family transcriptional regulator [Cyanobacteriota bacterium]|nr:TetR/AcrR family transcriptional regulator [Cyanobacteriota bacterium]